MLYLLSLMATAWPLMLMYLHLRGTLSPFPALANAALVMLPFFFITPRWRWSVLFPVWLSAVFILANIWYWRYFRDFIPVTSYFLFYNIDPSVAGAGFSMFKVKDIGVVIPAIGLTVLYIAFFRKHKGTRFSTRTRWIATAATIVLYSGVQCHTIISSYKERMASFARRPGLTVWHTARDFFFREQLSPWIEYDTSGLVLFWAKGCGYAVYNNMRDRSLSTEEVARIEGFWKKHERLRRAYSVADTLSFSPGNRNLILIVVESLNSWAVEYEHGGRKLMPVLDSLINAEGTLSSLKMVAQIRSGVSSDGQFIYNTGMYPASDVTTVSFYTGNKFYALPMYFAGRPSFEVICEGGSMWHHRETTLAYGYDRLYENVRRRASEESMGTDEAMFRTGLEVMDTIGQPFVAELTTMSMHGPYKDSNVNTPDWIAAIDGIPELRRDYMTVTNYFDTQLGNFLNELKRRNLYDSSLIVIASDHASSAEGMPTQAHGDIVFAAVNAGITKRINHPTGQVDVFPTILDLMGVADKGYRGMGLSMLNPKLDGAIDSNNKIIGDSVSADLRDMLLMTREVSDDMLRGDWFGQ